MEIIGSNWGELRFDNGQVTSDAKIYHDHVEDWDWKKTNTHHHPGVTHKDIKDLISGGCTHIIIGKGFRNKLEISGEALYCIMTENRTLFASLPTPEAVLEYNRYAQEGKKVGALIHTEG